MISNKEVKYISLHEAAKLTDYSQEYISLLCRKGKIKGKKLGRNWFTTKEWVGSYIDKISESKNILRQAQDDKMKEEKESSPEASELGPFSSFFILKKMMLATIVSGFLVSGFIFAQYFGSKVDSEIELQNLVLGVSDGIQDEIIALSNSLDIIGRR